jgi:hypothetical protein
MRVQGVGETGGGEDSGPHRHLLCAVHGRLRRLLSSAVEQTGPIVLV